MTQRAGCYFTSRQLCRSARGRHWGSWVPPQWGERQPRPSSGPKRETWPSNWHSRKRDRVLAFGIDSPALRALAAMDAPRAKEAFSILEQVLREAGTKLPTQREAALRLARKTAQEMLKGEMAAYEGSRQIWAFARHLTSES